MLHSLLSLIGVGKTAQSSGMEKLPCFHCGDLVRRRRAVEVQFDGAARLVCCHGCASILTTIAQMGMVQQYRAQKGHVVASDDN